MDEGLAWVGRYRQQQQQQPEGTMLTAEHAASAHPSANTNGSHADTAAVRDDHYDEDEVEEDEEEEEERVISGREGSRGGGGSGGDYVGPEVGGLQWDMGRLQVNIDEDGGGNGGGGGGSDGGMVGRIHPTTRLVVGPGGGGGLFRGDVDGDGVGLPDSSGLAVGGAVRGAVGYAVEGVVVEGVLQPMPSSKGDGVEMWLRDTYMAGV